MSKFHFIKNKAVTLAIIAVVLVVGIASFFIRGFNIDIDFSGGIVEAITNVKSYLKEQGKNIPIECEVRSLEDIDLVFEAGGVDRIMFDNFTPKMTRKAVEKVAGRCSTESSGGITLETMREYAEAGVDYISVGALTHQIKSLDLSLKACK